MKRMHRTLRYAFSLMLVAMMLMGRAMPAQARESDRVFWQGRPYYLYGANLPWVQNEHDFGGGTTNGVQSAASQALLNQAFSQAQAANMHVIRWFAFEGANGNNGAWPATQIVRDSQNRPIGLNPNIYGDFDAALALAEKYDLYYDFVLFASPQAKPAIPPAWMTDPTQRQMLANTLAPLFAHYANNPRILSWDILNEPEYKIMNGVADQASTVALGKLIAATIHANCHALATVGSAYYSWCQIWVGAGLDFYSPHYYDAQSGSPNADILSTDYRAMNKQYKLDAPVVVGECQLESTDAINPLKKLDDFKSKGYGGAWGWSLLPKQANDSFVLDMSACAEFGKRHKDLGPTSSAN